MQSTSEEEGDSSVDDPIIAGDLAVIMTVKCGVCEFTNRKVTGGAFLGQKRSPEAGDLRTYLEGCGSGISRIRLLL